jgi:hypothetical protein
MENVVFFSQEVMLRAFSENAPSLASIKIGPPSSSFPFCYAEGTPGARFQLSLYLDSFAHSIPVLNKNNVLQVFVMRKEPTVAPLSAPRAPSLSPLSLDFASTTKDATVPSSPNAERSYPRSSSEAPSPH